MEPFNPRTMEELTGLQYDIEPDPGVIEAKNLDEPTPLDAQHSILDDEIADDPDAIRIVEELRRRGYNPAEALEPEETPAPQEESDDSSTPSEEEAAATESEGEPSTNTFITVDFGEYGSTDLTIDEARKLMITNAWIDAKPPETWEILSQIEDGRAVPIAREDYELLRAVKEGRYQPVTQQSPTHIADADLYDLDPTVVANIRRLEAQAAAAQQQIPPVAQQQYQPPAPSPQQVAAATAARMEEAHAIQAIIDSGVQQFAEARNMSASDIQELTNYVEQNNLITQVIPKYQTRLPDGTIAFTDRAAALQEALDSAYEIHPSFRQRIIEQEVQRRLDGSAAITSAVQAKKTRAGALASAPSAAITTPEPSPGGFTRDKALAGMTEVIRQAMNGS